MKVVAVRFKDPDKRVYSGKEYFYKTLLGVSVGQEVVTYTEGKLQIAMVCRVNVADSNLAQGYIVQGINPDYGKLVESYQKLEKLSEAMDDRYKILQATVFSEILGQDKEFQSLLGEYRKIILEMKG